MKKLCFYILPFLFLGCLALEPNKDDSAQRIQALEAQNKELQQKNMEALAQNKRLKDLLEKSLQRLSVIQEDYKKLMDENRELYEKLHKERVAEQTQIAQEREKRMQELEKEAQQLLMEFSSKKEDIRNMLGQKREKLLEREAWTREDEKKFIDTMDKMMRPNLTPSEEQDAIRAALMLDEEMSRKLEKASISPK